jgi:hypothetical protein
MLSNKSNLFVIVELYIHKTTLSIMTLMITTLSITLVKIMTLKITTLCITLVSRTIITTLSLHSNFVINIFNYKSFLP